MLPSFEIYLSVLSDCWMPWLPDNRRQEKFESLLFALRPAAETSYSRFFRNLLPALKNTNSAVSGGFTEEVRQLSGMNGSFDPASLASSFVQLPAGSPRELFYHALIGFALEGYRNWLETALPEKDGEISAYVVTRTTDRLQSALQLPVPNELTAERELRLLYLVKVALAALFSTMLEKRTKHYRGITTVHQVIESTKLELNQCQLPGNERDELLRLLENLLSAGKTESVSSDINRQPQKRLEQEMIKPEPAHAEDNRLKELAAGWKEDVSEVKNAIARMMAENEAHQNEKEPEKMLGSGKVMELLGISKSSLSRYRETGIIPYRKIGGKFLYPESGILKLTGKNSGGNFNGNKSKKNKPI